MTINELDRGFDFMAEIIPELKAEKGVLQNNPHHIYDVYNHSQEAYGTSRRLTDDRIVHIAAALHDIGKPICKTTDENGIDHFYRHAEKGSYMCEKILKRLKFNKEQAEEICKLILYHDSQFGKRYSNFKKWKKRLSNKQLERLIILKKCDILSQNPQYCREKADEIRRIEEMLRRD